MEIIPAIDLLGGKCVRLTKGEYRRKKTYSLKPAAAARAFKAQGARRLHVIDLDGARSGRLRNLRAAAAIKRGTRLKIEFGGGLRNLEAIRLAFRAGMDAIIIGTAAYTRPDLLRRALARYGGKIMVSVDVRAGRVAVKGWKSTMRLSAGAAVKRLAKIGVKGILYTDTSRDGTLEGVDMRSIRRMVAACRKAGVFMHYAGGVRDIEDIRRLKGLDRRVLRGVVAGKALYEGTLCLRQAVGEAAGE